MPLGERATRALETTAPPPDAPFLAQTPPADSPAHPIGATILSSAYQNQSGFSRRRRCFLSIACRSLSNCFAKIATFLRG